MINGCVCIESATFFLSRNDDDWLIWGDMLQWVEKGSRDKGNMQKERERKGLVYTLLATHRSLRSLLLFRSWAICLQLTKFSQAWASGSRCLEQNCD